MTEHAPGLIRPEAVHITLIVAQDSATGIPVEHIRERAEFDDPADAERYEQSLRIWLAARPSPDLPGLTVRDAAITAAPEQGLRRILRLDEDEHLFSGRVVSGATVYDWEASGT
jgi:hypothetical protein